jgi:hypothetical protein
MGDLVRWSVVLVADGDREMSREEIVELADAVAANSGIASGIGTTSYGAQLVVVADSSEEAVELAMTEFVQAAAAAGLPPWPIARAEALSEDDDMAQDE